MTSFFCRGVYENEYLFLTRLSRGKGGLWWIWSPLIVTSVHITVRAPHPSSRLIWEVKHGRARLVRWWETTLEVRVSLLSFFTPPRPFLLVPYISYHTPSFYHVIFIPRLPILFGSHHLLHLREYSYHTPGWIFTGLFHWPDFRLEDYRTGGLSYD